MNKLAKGVDTGPWDAIEDELIIDKIWTFIGSVEVNEIGEIARFCEVLPPKTRLKWTGSNVKLRNALVWLSERLEVIELSIGLESVIGSVPIEGDWASMHSSLVREDETKEWKVQFEKICFESNDDLRRPVRGELTLRFGLKPTASLSPSCTADVLGRIGEFQLESIMFSRIKRNNDIPQHDGDPVAGLIELMESQHQSLHTVVFEDSEMTESEILPFFEFMVANASLKRFGLINVGLTSQSAFILAQLLQSKAIENHQLEIDLRRNPFLESAVVRHIRQGAVNVKIIKLSEGMDLTSITTESILLHRSVSMGDEDTQHGLPYLDANEKPTPRHLGNNEWRVENILRTISDFIGVLSIKSGEDAEVYLALLDFVHLNLDISNVYEFWRVLALCHAHHTSIISLRMNSCDIALAHTLLLAQARPIWKHLKSLNLKENDLSWCATKTLMRGFRDVPGLALQSLDLSCNLVGDWGVRQLIRGMNNRLHLVSLNLSRNCISDKGASMLWSGLKNRSHRIQSVDLSWNRLTSEALYGLADVMETKNALIELNLNSNKVFCSPKVKYAGALVRFCVALKNNQCLRTLRLGGNGSLSLTLDEAQCFTRAPLKELQLHRATFDERISYINIFKSLQGHDHEVHPSCLERLDLSGYLRANFGRIHLKRMLQLNRTLVSLNLSHIVISQRVLHGGLLAGLSENETLKELYLVGSIPFAPSLVDLLKALTSTIGLVLVDLSKNKVDAGVFQACIELESGLEPASRLKKVVMKNMKGVNGSLDWFTSSLGNLFHI